jgi:predicted AlkP superfamily pyrophosphatase or phosphodiesterase
VPHAKAYRTGEAPERWHYSGSRRIPPVFLVADDEWTIVTTHAYRKSHKPALGNHGYDNAAKDMRAMFMAAGPAFRHGELQPFANVQLYSLLSYLLNIVPAKTDGSLEVFKSILRTQIQPSQTQTAP